MSATKQGKNPLEQLCTTRAKGRRGEPDQEVKPFGQAGETVFDERVQLAFRRHVTPA